MLIDMYLCISVYIYVSLTNQISPFRSERCAFFWRSLQKLFLFLRVGEKMVTKWELPFNYHINDNYIKTLEVTNCQSMGLERDGWMCE